MDTKKLFTANIPEEWHQHCYIADDGTIFTPQFDRDGKEMVATGREAYDAWLAAKGSPPPAPPPDPRDLAITQLMREVAALKAKEADPVG